jgi:hypothetical protein
VDAPAIRQRPPDQQSLRRGFQFSQRILEDFHHFGILGGPIVGSMQHAEANAFECVPFSEREGSSVECRSLLSGVVV